MNFRNSELPPGMEDLGPSNDIKKNHPKLFDAQGSPVSSGDLVAPPIQWIEDTDVSDQGEKLYYPKIDTPLGTEYGATRNHKTFYKGEREMFIQVFAGHISKYIFGTCCVVMKDDDKGTYFDSNPDFEKLPVYEANS